MSYIGKEFINHPSYQNTYSINCTPVTTVIVTTAAATVTVPMELLPFFLHNYLFLLHLSFCLLLHGPFLSPQTSQIQFSPISRGGINWSVCRSNSLGTLHSTHWPVHASPRNRRKLDLWGLRRMNWTTAALHCTVLHSNILYCTTSTIYRCNMHSNKYFYQVW